jgi:hypothetical protein
MTERNHIRLKLSVGEKFNSLLGSGAKPEFWPFRPRFTAWTHQSYVIKGTALMV